jgi:hypothetical protein
MHEQANNIRPFKRVLVTRKKDLDVIPEYKLRLLEHIMLEQFNGPDEFYHAIDVLIEQWSESLDS